MSPAPLPNSWLLIPDARCTSSESATRSTTVSGNVAEGLLMTRMLERNESEHASATNVVFGNGNRHMYHGVNSQKRLPFSMI